MYCRRLLSTLFIACLIAQAQAGDVRVEGKFISTTTSGPPLEVSSTDNVNNLNADKLDGFDVGDFATAGSGVGVHYKNLVGLPGKEIDQDCALAVGGCFSGDSQGFPVTITEPGSYRLASNLDVSGETNPEDVTAIEINTSNVVLDLRGFNIRGPVTCTGTPVTSCSPTSGLGRGVHLLAGSQNVAIRNGTIQGMGSFGVLAGSDVQMLVADVVIKESDSTGLISINPGNSTILRNVSAFRNGSNGIGVSGGVIENCHAFGNTFDGLSTQDNATVRGCVAQSNGDEGFSLLQSRASDTAAGDNGRHGYFCNDCLLLDSLSKENGGFGVSFAGTTSAWKGNLIFGNTDGAINGTEVNLGDNVCNGSLC